MSPRFRDERGSATVETVIGVPAFLLLIGLLVLGGRIAIASQVVQAAASDAARAASLARTVTDSKGTSVDPKEFFGEEAGEAEVEATDAE